MCGRKYIDSRTGTALKPLACSQLSLRGLAFGNDILACESKNQQSPGGEQSQTPGSFGTKAPGVTLRSLISKHLQNESCTFECI